MLKLEKRLDENLMYLRDALPEYSTFDVNMKPVPRMDHEEIPVNKVGATSVRGKAQDYLQPPFMTYPGRLEQLFAISVTRITKADKNQVSLCDTSLMKEW